MAMTQDQLAAASGIDSSNIRAYENGRSTPGIHSLVRLADALAIEPGALLQGLTLQHFAAPQEAAPQEATPQEATPKEETRTHRA